MDKEIIKILGEYAHILIDLSCYSANFIGTDLSEKHVKKILKIQEKLAQLQKQKKGVTL